MAHTAQKRRKTTSRPKPVVLITGAAGDIGSALIERFKKKYRVVGLDMEGKQADCDLFTLDLSSPDSVSLALRNFREKYGGQIASVIHLAAYFDFTGEENPLYEKVNVDGTRNLLRSLQRFDVDQFVYSGTMLVHRPSEPGSPITEATEIEPKWAYPRSKARAENAIRKDHGHIPYVILRLAGLYDDETAVPTLSEQIKRIYERDPKAHLYSGSLKTGQSFVHKEDMVEAFFRSVERRDQLPGSVEVLIGEPEAVSYRRLQTEIGRLIHGEGNWKTITVPKLAASAGAWLEEKSEPIVPDDLDQGEKPFIRSFMVEMADDHYELDVSNARNLLGWEPVHNVLETLPKIIGHLKSDPLAWYEANGITPPPWLEAAGERCSNPENLRDRAESDYREQHYRFLWAPFTNIALGFWLLASPLSLGYSNGWLALSDYLSGALICVFAAITLSWRFGMIRWLLAATGTWVMFAPLAFWVPTAAGYLNGTIVGMLVFALAVAARPAPGISILARTTGPTIPPGWDFSPSDWFQRIPVIALAVIGLLISRYMAAYQLGHIDGVWEPFFAGAAGNMKNGTEEIITSRVSQAWPVPDAGLGALTYALEILVGLIGSSRRWRTMPWVVVVFGIMIVPLGMVSITFIVIQPIILGTWCTLCLIAAAAMLIQIPYSVDELVATGQFLMRRYRAGRPILRVFLFGDTDEGADHQTRNNFSGSIAAIVRDILGGGVTINRYLAGSVLVGVWLMFTRLTLGTSDTMADADHLIGALVVTTSVVAVAESMRPVRFLNVLFGMALIIMPFIAAATSLQTAGGVLAGIVLIVLSIPRGEIHHRYGSWSRLAV